MLTQVDGHKWGKLSLFNYLSISACSSDYIPASLTSRHLDMRRPSRQVVGEFTGGLYEHTKTFSAGVGMKGMRFGDF